VGLLAVALMPAPYSWSRRLERHTAMRRLRRWLGLEGEVAVLDRRRRQLEALERVVAAARAQLL
jgi:hypothetical protein